MATNAYQPHYKRNVTAKHGFIVCQDGVGLIHKYSSLICMFTLIWAMALHKYKKRTRKSFELWTTWPGSLARRSPWLNDMKKWFSSFDSSEPSCLPNRAFYDAYIRAGLVILGPIRYSSSWGSTNHLFSKYKLYITYWLKIGTTGS